MQAINRPGGSPDSNQRLRKVLDEARPYLPTLSQHRPSNRIPKEAGPCFNLGDMKGTRSCPSCRGKTRQKVFACHHSLHVETVIEQCRRCQDYDPPLLAKRVSHWCVGVTTAPRIETTLERSLVSLSNAGWSKPHLFAEPGVRMPRRWSRSCAIKRTTTLGAWPNFLLALCELVMREPNADAYLMCQDDVIYSRGLRKYLEDSLWPTNRVGVVSLHTARHQDVSTKRGFFEADLGWSAWGAQAYIFPNPAARAFLADPRVINHRQRGPGEGKCNVDSVVGDWCQRNQLPYYLHSPSLTQHIGETSTLWKSATTAGRRSAASFVGEDQDIGTFLRQEESQS